MAMAWKGTEKNHDRKTFVTEHAVQRLRERLREGKDIIHRTDQDLMNLLDDMTVDAFARGTAVTVRDSKDELAWTVDLQDELHFPLTALVKEFKDKAGKPVAGKRTVVTVMDTAWAGRMVKRWTAVPHAAPGVAKLADNGKNAERLRVALEETLKKEQTTLAANQPQPDPHALVALTPPAPQPVPSERLISYTKPGERADSYTPCAVNALATLVESLLASGVDPKTIRVWKPMTVKTRIAVEIDE